MHVTAKFHHPTFNRSEVIVLINRQTSKQTPLKTSTSLRYATPEGKNFDLGIPANIYEQKNYLDGTKMYSSPNTQAAAYTQA